MTWRAMVADCLHRLPPRMHELVPVDERTQLRHWLGRRYPWEEGADLSPPARRPGETIGPPDFVGIGAANVGVRWWYELLVGHPSVSARLGAPMASHFLAHFATRAFGDIEVEHYHRLFPRRLETIAGEWSPSYLALPWVAELLARAAPETRLLLMVRNPLDRLRRALAQTIDNRGPQLGVYIADAVDRGFYGAQLRRVLKFFPPERVLVLQYERCNLEPADQLAATFAFLGLDDPAAPIRPGDPRPRRVSPVIEPDAIDQLVQLYAEDVADLASMVPQLDLSLWPEFAGERGPDRPN